MRIQLLSDLHLESESFDPWPNPDADVLVLAGDIDRSWEALTAFRDWPVPVLFVPGNHEFDGRELVQAETDLRTHCEALGLVWLHRGEVVLQLQGEAPVRFLGAIRWADFDLFGSAGRPRALRAAGYFMRLMDAKLGERPFDAAAMREEGLRCRRWLEDALSRRGPPGCSTVVITHFGPSLRSADPRYGRQPSTASFCNADDDLIGRADLWLHGHLHCRNDYGVERAGRRPTRVVCEARGLASKGEDQDWEPSRLIAVPGTAAGAFSLPADS
jgi:predicted phosphodiesterase